MCLAVTEWGGAGLDYMREQLERNPLAQWGWLNSLQKLGGMLIFQLFVLSMDQLLVCQFRFFPKVSSHLLRILLYDPLKGLSLNMFIIYIQGHHVGCAL